jgi:hypothetical protein
VDVTPRRTQRFKLQSGEQVQWTSTGAANPLQSGTAAADANGLVTLHQVEVAKKKTVIRVIRTH